MTPTTRAALPVLLALALVGSACSPRQSSLAVSPDAYAEAVAVFHTGLAAMQTSQDGLALEKFQRLTVLVPQEPAGWANLALLYLRHQELEQASTPLERAVALAPAQPGVLRLQALAHTLAGRIPEAIDSLKHTLKTEPTDTRSAFTIAQLTERLGGAANEQAAEQAYAALLRSTGNLAVRLEYARLAAAHGNATALGETLAPLAALAEGWPPEAREQWEALKSAAAKDTRSAELQAVFLKNILVATPGYRTALAAVSNAQDSAGEPLVAFLALPNPVPKAAAPDTALAFTAVPSRAQGSVDAVDVSIVSLRGEGAPVVATATPSGVFVAGRIIPGTAGAARMLPVDLNYDFRTDLVVAGPKGLRLFQQSESGAFADVTSAARLPGTVTSGVPAGLWAADTDLDGDLDVIAAPDAGAPVLLRNNGDGTFAAGNPWPGVSGLRAFVWVDLDGDGTPDAAMLDATGTVQVFLNARGGAFTRQALPPVTAVALTAGDISHGRTLDLVLLAADGAINRLALPTGALTVVARVSQPPTLALGTARITIADLDNNGAADLVVSGSGGTRVLLAGNDQQFSPLADTLPFMASAAADLDSDGRLDLVGVNAAHQLVTFTSHGSKTYHWQVVRPRAAQAQGDQRINSFGIGGEVEVRSGLHLQRQTITSPTVHFGLGDATLTNVVRITWPNGVLQSDFDQKADAVMLADQRLKGSCPWLFAWNGHTMRFVSDLIWRSPLGLRINAQATADVVMTEDRVKVPGEAIAARNGAYDLRITAELWETHFFDLVSLLVVDHPVGTEVFIDERFAVPAPSLDVIVTSPVGRFESVRDDRGREVGDVVRDRDDRHLDFAGRGPYQGITRDHVVEMTLPDDAPRGGPLWLVAQGWIHPTDSSVNVAISQGTHPAPRGLSLEVADESGRFHTARANLGFPAGKDKTVMLDLSGLFPRQGPRRLRLSTNLEIFWDRLGWAVGRPDVHVEPQRLALRTADLRFRGYSPTSQSSPSSPERPEYSVAGTSPRWLDLEGYYTRYGDVRELLTGVDDRYVIMNAGDELRLQFPEAAAPRAGTTRDFIVMSDGWVKDGDYNTSFSRTVLPLPTHRNPRYDTPPGRLAADTVYRRQRQDFMTYHTRYVGPEAARQALR